MTLIKSFKDSFDGGFNIDYVHDINNKPLQYVINQTMMRINLPKPLSTGDSFIQNQMVV